MNNFKTLSLKKNSKGKKKLELNTLKFSILNGFLLYLPYEKKDLAKENGFRFLKDKKAWYSEDYRGAYKVIQADPDIKCSAQLKNFFKFYGENLWDSVKKIRQALVELKRKCDYAQMRDSSGFSQSDKRLGRELAYKEKWNNSDILKAAWIVYLHRRQVKNVFSK